MEQFDLGNIGVHFDADPTSPEGIILKGKHRTTFVMFFDEREDIVLMPTSRKEKEDGAL